MRGQLLQARDHFEMARVKNFSPDRAAFHRGVRKRDSGAEIGGERTFSRTRFNNTERQDPKPKLPALKNEAQQAAQSRPDIRGGEIIPFPTRARLTGGIIPLRAVK